MPDLTPWIEAQLKRGHTKEEVKKYLAHLGYPASAVVQVDRIGRFGKMKTPNPRVKATNSKPLRTVNFPLVALLAVGAAGILLLWLTDAFSSQSGPELQAPEELEQVSPPPQVGPAELCSGFTAQEEQACEKVVLYVTSKYTGTVANVKKEEGGTGAFVLRMLTDQGKMLVTAVVAENSVIVKDVVTSGTLNRTA